MTRRLWAFCFAFVVFAAAVLFFALWNPHNNTAANGGVSLTPFVENETTEYDNSNRDTKGIGKAAALASQNALEYSLRLQQTAAAAVLTGTKANEHYALTAPQPILEPPPEALAAIYETLAKYGNNISVYYENLETSHNITYNAERERYAASIIKAPYALYIYNLAERGGADLEQTHTYRASHHRTGAGVIQSTPQGDVFTTQKLLEYLIVNSDNIAMVMLQEAFPVLGFKEFLTSEGLNAGKVQSLSSANTTAYEAGRYAKKIFAYLESGGEYSAAFKQHLLDAINPYIKAAYPVAHKYGWYGDALHDMAIVYAPSPYVLAVLTNYSREDAAANGVFREVSAVFAEHNKNWYE